MVNTPRRQRINSLSSTEGLESLLNSPNVMDRQKLAGSLKATPEMLAKLTDDVEFTVRARLAKRRTLPPGALRKLAKDPHWKVRAMVAVNRVTTFDLLIDLAQDSVPSVRASLMLNKSTILPIIMGLMNDPNVHVRAAVAKQVSQEEIINNLVKNFSNLTALEQDNLMKNAFLGGDSIHKLVTSESNRFVHLRASKHLNTLPETIEWLASRSTHDTVRHMLAVRRETPAEVLSEYTISHPEWASELSKNLNLPAEAFYNVWPNLSAQDKTSLLEFGNIPEALAAQSVFDKNLDVSAAARYTFNEEQWKTVLVANIEKNYPEVTVDMPLEWLEELGATIWGSEK